MKILIIDNSAGFTGAFKCVLNEALLLKTVHQFHFIIPSQSSNKNILEAHGFQVTQLPMKELSKSLKSIAQYPFYLLSNLLKLKKILRKERIDIVQVNDFYNLLGAALKMTGSQFKLITYVRFLPSSLQASLRKLWTNSAQKNSAFVVAVSDAVLNQLPKNKNTIRIYDSVALEERLPYTAHESELKTFLFLANYTKGKGQEYALASFAKAYATQKNIRLKFVGGYLGLDKNKNFRAALETQCRTLGIEEAVSFDDFEKDTERLIKEAYVLLNFSEAESFSMTCLEASFYGTPVIATRCGGPEEIIENNKTGLLVAKKDIDAMAVALQTLAADTSLRNQFSIAGRSYVRTKFSQQLFLEQFQKLLSIT